jgi:ferredoxin-NADP reductase
MHAAKRRQVPSPPANMLTVQIVRREVVARDAVSLFLVLAGTHRSPGPYLPGQFVTLALPSSHGMLYRSYSLCGLGRPNEPWEITIKRVPRGVVSTFLHDSTPVGAYLYATTPRGTFTLPSHVRSDMVLVFVAAGSGITPIRGMLRTLALVPAAHRPHVQLHYASRSTDEILFRSELDQLDPQQAWLRQWHYLSTAGNRLTAAAVVVQAGTAAVRAHWYVCGPDGLRHDLQTTLTQRGVPPAQIHTEVFATENARAPVGRGLPIDPMRRPVAAIRVQETGAVLSVYGGETLLTALERHGYRPDFSCRSGTCGTCKLRVLVGRAEPSGAGVLPSAERRDGYVLSCIAKPLGDVTLLSGGRAPVRSATGAIAPVKASSRSGAKALLRMASLVAAAGLLGGAWTLTDHKPVKGATASAPPPAATSAPVSTPTATPLPTDTPLPIFGQPTAIPTAPPADTPTPVPPTATPVPIPPPQPTVVTQPS